MTADTPVPFAVGDRVVVARTASWSHYEVGQLGTVRAVVNESRNGTPTPLVYVVFDSDVKFRSSVPLDADRLGKVDP